MMNLNFPSRPRRGFSLVELLTVVIIIVILATLVIGALNAIKKGNADKAAQVRVNAAKSHLESYAGDNNGQYPVGADVFSEELYKALSGDFTGRLEGEPEGVIYWRELLDRDSDLVGKRNGSRIILDGYGVSIRYRAAVDFDGVEDEKAKNPDFDVWSIGRDGEPSDPEVDSNLENEQTLDDVWPS